MIHIHEVEQGNPEWHELRKGKYTGSNADKLLSHSSSKKVIDGISSGYALTETSGFRGNFHTKRGHILEDEAIELYEEITGRKVGRPGFVTNDSYPTCGYSPDGLCEDILIEVKCFTEAKHMKIFNGDMPIKILAQIYFGLLICNLKKAELIIYNPDLEAGHAFKIIEVRAKRAIESNFKRILLRERANYV